MTKQELSQLHELLRKFKSEALYSDEPTLTQMIQLLDNITNNSHAI